LGGVIVTTSFLATDKLELIRHPSKH
jgi:hypothetical protein